LYVRRIPRRREAYPAVFWGILPFFAEFYKKFVEVYRPLVEFYRVSVDVYKWLVEFYKAFVEIAKGLVDVYKRLGEVYRGPVEGKRWLGEGRKPLMGLEFWVVKSAKNIGNRGKSR